MEAAAVDPAPQVPQAPQAGLEGRQEACRRWAVAEERSCPSAALPAAVAVHRQEEASRRQAVTLGVRLAAVLPASSVVQPDLEAAACREAAWHQAHQASPSGAASSVAASVAAAVRLP